MKPFKLLFDLVTLPINIVKDVVLILPVITGDAESSVKKKIEELDEDLES